MELSWKNHGILFLIFCGNPGSLFRLLFIKLRSYLCLSGRCICEDNTMGDNCEMCEVGYYGSARDGNEDDCNPCPCPNQGPCIQIPGGEIICTQCDEGYGGNLCDICLDGFYGDPKGWYGPERPCERCMCNENIDPNAVGNCNRYDINVKWATSWQNQLNDCAPSEDLAQPGHSPSLIRVFLMHSVGS